MLSFLLLLDLQATLIVFKGFAIVSLPAEGHSYLAEKGLFEIAFVFFTLQHFESLCERLFSIEKISFIVASLSQVHLSLNSL